jgi:phosphatidylinositol alpha-1,6-mannosyltransferase
LLVANSRYTAQRVAEAHPWMGPVAECPLALSPDDTLPAQADPDSGRGPAAAPRVLVVARMVASERYKGHDALIDAWPHVLRAVPDAMLILAGDGDDVPRLKARAAAAGLDRSVVFPGFVTPQTLDALYRGAAVFAMPSRDEGFGLVYLEAMAHGLPCVGSTHDAARDVIDDGITGFLVDQADREALTQRLVDLLTDERLRRDMGARGRRRLVERFSYDAFRSRMRSLLTDSLGSPRVSVLSSASAPVR